MGMSEMYDIRFSSELDDVASVASGGPSAGKLGDYLFRS